MKIPNKKYFKKTKKMYGRREPRVP
jgi:hypothetical protein